MSEERIPLDTPLRIGSPSFYQRRLSKETYQSYAALMVNASIDSDLFVRIIGDSGPEEGNSVVVALDDELEPLESWLRRNRHLLFTKENDLTEVLQIVLFGILSALSYLNDRRIVIEPLTAKNVVIDRYGRPKLQHLDVMVEGFEKSDVKNNDKFGVLKVLDIKESPGHVKVEELGHFVKFFGAAAINRSMQYVDGPSLWPKHVRLMYRSMGYDNLSFLVTTAVHDLRKMQHKWVGNARAKGGEYEKRLKKGRYKDNGMDFLRFSRAVAYHADNIHSCNLLEDELTTLWPRFMPSYHRILVSNKIYFSRWYYHDIQDLI